MGINKIECDYVFSSYTDDFLKICIYSLITLVRQFSSFGLYYKILTLSTVFFFFFPLDIPQNKTFEDKGF